MSKHQPIDISSSARLGTAAWYRAEGGAVGKMKKGDFYLGRLENGESVGFRDDRHVLLCGGTRAGKGISVIVPNLCAWPGSVVVIDPKAENAMVTARARGKGSRYSRSRGQKIYILDPFDAVGTKEDDFADLKVAFNPLDMIDPANPESVDEAGRIADALIVTEAASDPFWDELARSLLKMVTLHVATGDFLPHERTLVTVRKLVMAGDTGLRDVALASGVKEVRSGHAYLFESMTRNRAFEGVIANAGEMFGNLERNAERTFGGIVQIACTNTDFIDSPGMKRCLSKSDFRISELKTNPKGVSLYISLPDRYTRTHYRWLRMMVMLTLTEMERVRQKPASGVPVLVVLDEFPALKRMQSVENAAAQIAGYGVKLMFVVQHLPQIKDLYRDNWETLVANAGVKLFFGNDDLFTREYVSKLIGDCEVLREVQSFSQTEGVSRGSSHSATSGKSNSISISQSERSYSINASSGTSSSESWSSNTGQSESRTGGSSMTIQKRPLVTPDEIGRLFGDVDNPTALALISGYQPIFLWRTFYFRDPSLAGLFDPHCDHVAPPTLKQLAVDREEEKWRVMRERLEQDLRKEKEEKEQRERRAAHERVESERKRRDEILRKEKQDKERKQREFLECWEKEKRARERKIENIKILIVLIAGLCATAVVLWWSVPPMVWFIVTFVERLFLFFKIIGRQIF